ncbi:MAG: hypothetical protein ACJ72D_00520 [Marmoricola sp.]
MRAVLLVVAGVLLAGCGAAPASVPAPAKIDAVPGKQVGAMAERQLEAEHPGMARGVLTCPDLAWRLRATVRCVQVAVLSGGRRLTIPGTVTVTSVRGGGRMHVRLDDEVAEYGITAEHLSADLRTRAAARWGRIGRVRCPYLTGPVGTTVACRVTVRGKTRPVAVRVTGRDQARSATTYTFDWRSRG